MQVIINQPEAEICPRCGGYGFLGGKDKHIECPECHGYRVTKDWVKKMRKLCEANPWDD